MQNQDGIMKAIAYISTTFNQAEIKYSVLDKELTALRWAVKRLKPFLYGRFFIIHSDHKPLSYLQGMRLLDARLARTLEELGEFDFEIRYVPGKLNTFADALSRSSLCQYVNLSLDPSSYLSSFEEHHVKPGADTLFRCLSIFKCGDEHSHIEIRQETIEEILSSPENYNIELTSTLCRQLKLSRHAGVMPCYESVQAFCNKQSTPVFIYEDTVGFVRYEPLKRNPQRKPAYLRSYDSVCFYLLSPSGDVDLQNYKFCSKREEEVVVLKELADDLEVVEFSLRIQQAK